LTEKKIKKDVDFLLKQLQTITGVSDKKMAEFKKIIEIADFSEE
tara:strand:+ start:541 stop:672 length:132 start_codon:yes stop_codon:yes gene_type:complete